MSIIQKERLVKKGSVYAPSSGRIYFSTDSDNSFHGCRESFQRSYKPLSSFSSQVIFLYIRKNTVELRDLAEFVLKVETLLKVPQVEQSKFYYAQYKGQAPKYEYKDCFAIHPSIFWREHKLKISFLTAMLKGFVNCDHMQQVYRKTKTLNQLILLLSNVSYFRNGIYSLARFVHGGNYVSKDITLSAWMSHMSNRPGSSIDRIDKILQTRPKPAK